MDDKKELMKLDLYDILGIPPNSDEKQIKEGYRKKSRKCHPDKNPNDKNAAKKFIQLKKISEILLDSSNKTEYDKLLNGRKEAEIRARNFSAKSKLLKSQFEKREKEYEIAKEKRKREEELDKHNKWVRMENARIVEKDLEEQRLREQTIERPKSEEKSIETVFIVKAKWKETEDFKGFLKEELEQIFGMWGKIIGIAAKKESALIEYENKTGADMAVSYVIGPPGKPIKVKHKNKDKSKGEKTAKDTDYESIFDMNQRRADERKKLIEEMQKHEAD